MDTTFLYPLLSSLLIFPLGLVLAGWLIKRRAKAGWQPLAAAYPLTGPVGGPQTTLYWASVGSLLGDKNLVRAGATAAGLSLRQPLLAWLGYSPMRIPWAACGPFQAEKHLLRRTRYVAQVRLPGGALVPVRFEDRTFGQVLRQWVPVGD